MTAAMRALRPIEHGPRVLRVAVVSSGPAGPRIVEERVVERRSRVTVGPREDCTFVVPERQGPPVVLFEPSGVGSGAGWVLCAAAGLRGRVSQGGHVLDADAQRITLSADARGRVTLGDTTFLFQVVAKPPAASRPQLPLAVKAGLGAQVDWGLTVLVALSFLMHFGLVGGLYSDWMDPVVDEGFTARFVVPPSPRPPPPVETSDETTATSAPATSETTAATSPSARRPTPRPAPARDPASDVDALLREGSDLRVVAIGVTAPGANLRRALQQGEEGPPVDLRALAERATGVEDRASELGLPRASGPIEPGRRGDLTELEHRQTGPVASTAGTARLVVPFTLSQEPPRTTAAIANVESVIRTQLQPRARACYQRAVNADQALPDGSLTVVIRVAPSGEVTSAGITGRTGLSAPVESCIAGAAQRLVFDAPGPPGATVAVPMHFVKQ